MNKIVFTSASIKSFLFCWQLEENRNTLPYPISLFSPEVHLQSPEISSHSLYVPPYVRIPKSWKNMYLLGLNWFTIWRHLIFLLTAPVFDFHYPNFHSQMSSMVCGYTHNREPASVRCVHFSATDTCTISNPQREREKEILRAQCCCCCCFAEK